MVRHLIGRDSSVAVDEGAFSRVGELDATILADHELPHVSTSKTKQSG